MKSTFYFDGISPRMMQYISSKESSDMKEHTVVHKVLFKGVLMLVAFFPAILFILFTTLIAYILTKLGKIIKDVTEQFASYLPDVKFSKVIEVDGKPIKEQP